MSNATTRDEKRCRWPECDCYSPQGPGTCRRAGVYANSTPGKSWDEAYAPTPLSQGEGETPK